MNLLLSFPRTGSTWTRYILESFSQQTVDGHYDKTSVHATIEKNGFDTLSYAHCNKNVFATMVHTVPDIRSKPDKLVLSYRRAVEVIPSFQYSENHANKQVPIQEWMSRQVPRNFEGRVNQYLKNIKYYHDFDGPKMILWYNNLMKEPMKTIEQLTKFFGVDNEDFLRRFEDHYDFHKDLSLKYKSLPKHMAVNTSGKTGVIEDMLPDDVKDYLNEQFKDIEQQ